jgi:hypothetical protein
MRGIASGIGSLSVILVLGCTLFACGTNVELTPEVQAHLAEYENLIDTYQARFAEARGNPAKFADVADAYSEEAKQWMSRWSTVAPNPSDEEGKAIKASIDKLNKRAVHMLKGS